MDLGSAATEELVNENFLLNISWDMSLCPTLGLRNRWWGSPFVDDPAAASAPTGPKASAKTPN